MFSVVCAAFSAGAANTSLAKVDGVTQATIHNNIKFVLPLSVTADSAEIKWTDTKSRSKSGNVVLSYGTGEGSTLERQVTTAEATSLKFTLKNLKAKTTYKIRLQVTQASGAHAPCADTTTITTLATTSTIQQLTNKKDIPLEVSGHSITLGSMVRHGDQLSFVDLKGQTLLSAIVSGNESTVVIPSSVKGIVFLTCRRNGNIVSNKKVTIIQ